MPGSHSKYTLIRLICLFAYISIYTANCKASVFFAPYVKSLCNSREVKLLFVEGDEYICDVKFQVILRRFGVCPLTAISGKLCDDNNSNCQDCEFVQNGNVYAVFECTAIRGKVIQVFSAYYNYGDYRDVISISKEFTCDIVTCDPSSVFLAPLSEVIGVRSNFSMVLYTTSDCLLTSGGALVCNEDHRGCINCHGTRKTPKSLIYSCISAAQPGLQQFDATFNLGGTISVLTTTIQTQQKS